MPADDTLLILALAERRGLIPTPGVEDREDPEERLGRLLREGLLSEELVSELAGELARGIGSDETLASRGARAGDLPAGTNRFEVQGLLGEGGMGRVVRAWDRTLGRPVALKFLLRQGDRATARFQREARAQARIHHPHVCPVYEVGEADGQPFIAMECIDGPTFAAAAAGMTLEEKVAVLADVADAAHAAHAMGLIHRDLKLGNVLIKTLEDGRRHAYVTDFGLARELGGDAASHTREAVGTPQFMAPEQARGEPVDRRADVYSLGAMLYNLLVGEPPWSGSVPEVLRLIVEAEPVPPRQRDRSVPVDLETIALRCLAKRREERYGSARELADELRRWLRGEPILARPLGPLARLWRRARRHRALVGVSAAALVAIAALGVNLAVSRATAARQGRLGQQLGEEVARIDALMREAYLRPRHDLTADRARVAERMDAIAAILERQGAIAEGPASYALGAGHLALRHYDEARRHLERAWRAGFRTPEAAEALGRTLGALYQRGLVETRHLANADDRAQRRLELGATLRDRAAGYLLAARAARPESADLIDGLLALHDGRTGDARAAGARAFARDPSLHEALLLQADAEVAGGRAREDAADYEEALAAYARAGELYRQAAEIARSDPRPLEAECQRLAAVIEASDALQKPWGDALDRALAASDAALEADAGSLPAIACKAAAYVAAARSRLRAAADIRPLVAQTVALIHAAEVLAPDDEDLLALEARALSLRVAYEAATGEDPSAAVAAATAVLERLGARAPQLATVPSLIGRINRDLGHALDHHGQDPRPALDRAAAAFERALAMKQAPDMVNNLASIYAIRADYEYLHGGDWRSASERALALGRRATAQAPRRPDTWLVLSMIAESPAHFAVNEDQDPGEALALTISSARRALELNPKYGQAREVLAGALVLAARDAARRGQDPEPYFAESLAAYDQALGEVADPAVAGNKVRALIEMIKIRSARGGDVAPLVAEARRVMRAPGGDIGNLVLAADVELCDAELAAERGRSPVAALARAAAHLDKARALTPQAGTDVLMMAARLARVRAAWQVAHHDDAAPALAEARRALAEVLAQNPTKLAALEEQAQLEVLAVRLAREPETRRAAAGRARAALAAVLERSGGTRRAALAPLLAEVEAALR